MGVFDPNNWSPSEREYYESIDEIVKNGKDFTISNSMPSHAMYLIKKLLDTAVSEIRIYSRKLTLVSDIDTENGSPLELYSHPEIVNAFKKFLKSGKKLKLVTEQALDGGYSEHPLIKVVKKLEELQDDIHFEIKQASPSLIKTLEDRGMNDNMVIRDSTAFRLEVNADKCEAFANFGSPKLAGRLKSFYEETLWPNSMAVDGPIKI